MALQRFIAEVQAAVSRTCIGRPVFTNVDVVLIRWIFRFGRQDNSVTEMDELAYQRWEGEQIASETFIYDPARRVPKRPV
jgi:hypothetical protein